MILESLISIIIAIVIAILVIRNNYKARKRNKYKIIIDYLEECLINHIGFPEYSGLCRMLKCFDERLYNKEIRDINKDIEKELKGRAFLGGLSLKRAYDQGFVSYSEAIQIRLDLLHKLRKKYKDH